MEDVDKEISEMKLSLNARARIVAESYLSTVRISAISVEYQLTDVPIPVRLISSPISEMLGTVCFITCNVITLSRNYLYN